MKRTFFKLWDFMTYSSLVVIIILIFSKSAKTYLYSHPSSIIAFVTLAVYVLGVVGFFRLISKYVN